MKNRLTSKLIVVTLLVFSIIFMLMVSLYWIKMHSEKTLISSTLDVVEITPPKPVEKPKDKIERVKVTANGDLLYHDIIYWSAYNPITKTYDFEKNYDGIRSLIQSADLAIANYEGSISDQFPLSGYPLFNAPKEVAGAIKNAGYDVVSLANNHIVDSRGVGIVSTHNAFSEQGLDVMGVHLKENEPILIKEVNGIKIALLAYSYAFNGMDATLDATERFMIEPLDPQKIEADIKLAETLADVTIVYPHMGIEYQLQPTQEQMDLYHNMVDWGADLVFGNHPHVVQPSEVIQKDGLDKFIIYSMGNLISNQRLETMKGIQNYEWTERGIIIEANLLQKNDGPVTIDSIVLHPTWMSRTFNNQYSGGYQLYDYQVLLAQDYLQNSELTQSLDDDTLSRIRNSYQAIIDHVALMELQKGPQ